MSASTEVGLPLPFGVINGITKDLFANIMPEISIFKYESPETLKDLNELGNYNTFEMIPGTCKYIKSVEENAEFPALNKAEFLWDGRNWIKIGDIPNKQYLNIYAMTEENNEKYVELFMHLHVRNIQSNIRLLELLNNQVTVYNTDMFLCASLNGIYNINTDNIFKSLFSINITRGISVVMNKLCLKYGIPQIKFVDMSNYIINTLTQFINETNLDFINLTDIAKNIDISMYTNYIASIFASFEYILNQKYDDKDKLIDHIDPSVKLQIIDTPLYDRLKINKDLNIYFNLLLQKLFLILYNEDESSESFYIHLKNIINYFNINNVHILPIKKNRLTFFKDLCEGIAGVINLALLFTFLSNAPEETRTILFFQFLDPDKYK